MSNRVLITGGNGFTGSHIVREFLKNHVNVTCIVRPGSSTENIDGLGADIVEGDITKQDTLNRALRGCDFVVHNAALVNDWDDYDNFYKTNVVGTMNVLFASIDKKIDGVIITGSISSYGEEDCNITKDESFDFNSHYDYFLDSIFPCKMNYYRDTKALATKEAIEFAKENQMDLTIIEPTFVYGEREFSTGFYEYLRAASRGMFAAPGSKKNKFPIVYAGDLSRAYYLAYKRRLKGINRFIIGNEQAEYMDKILEIFCDKAGITKPTPLPKWLAYPPGFILEIIWSLLKRKDAPLLTRGRVNMFVDNVDFSCAKARRLLAYKSAVPLSEGIERTVNWYREKGYI